MGRAARTSCGDRLSALASRIGLSADFSSSLRSATAFAQYQARSIDRPCLESWPSSRSRIRVHTLLPRGKPGFERSTCGFAGTADAVYRNLDLIDQLDPDIVLILAGDHVYRADYRALFEVELDRMADATVLTSQAPAREASSFGVLSLDRSGRLAGMVEKPIDPDRWAEEGTCTISLGVYCFLRACLHLDASDEDSAHDFGSDILPRAIQAGRIFTGSLEDPCPEPVPYWRDAGTIESYFRAQLDLVKDEPPFELADPAWPSRSFDQAVRSSRSFISSVRGAHGFGEVKRSLICEGAKFDGAVLSGCIVSPWARTGRGARLEDCVVLPGGIVGEGARLRKVIDVARPGR